MILGRCDIIVEPGAGAPIAEVFRDVLYLSRLTCRSIIVRGNGAEIPVTPAMDEDDCRAAYERALARRDAHGHSANCG